MTDEDWFDRALTDEEDVDSTEGGESDEGADADSANEGSGTDVEGDAGSEGDVEGDAVSEADREGDGASDASPASGDDAGGEGALFDDDFASEFGDVANPAATGGGPFDGPVGSAGSPFGGTGGVFGGEAGGGFAGEGAAGGGGGQFGTREFGGSDPEDFSDASLESDIERIDLGITGLDEMIRGGVPDSSLMAVIGSAGTGKTTFGLQFLQQGLAKGERGIYIALEESEERIVTSAEEKGWSFGEYVESDRLAVVDMDPIEMANSLSSIRNDLPRLIEGFGATRLVLDSVSLLEMMYDDRATRRNEIYTFARSLKESGVTILLISEADEGNPYSSRHGIVEYLADAVFILQYVRPSDFQETRLAVEIQKIRDAHHSRAMKPYEITDEGLSVYRQANIF